MWYSTFKRTLIDLGFAREKEATDTDTVGEVVFHPGQLERIVNFDETDGLIDRMNGKRRTTTSNILLTTCYWGGHCSE
jgi:hypothetical protein